MDYEKNEFYANVKVTAEYNGGQSRNGEYAVDYILVNIGETELYAEVPADNEDNIIALQQMIAEQTEEKGIDLDLYNPLFKGWID